MRSTGPLRVKETSKISQGRERDSSNVAGHVFSAEAAHDRMGMVGAGHQRPGGHIGLTL